MFLIVSPISLVNSLLAFSQNVILGRKIRRTEIKDDPIFVIGHWRSGTTLLHELLVLDPRHTYPNTYDCFAPSHFLVSAWLFRPLLGVLMPKQRPMDNMAAGWDCPQEDEFALCNLGMESPYLTIAFPNHAPQCQQYLDLAQVSEEARAQWKEGLRWLLKCITARRPGRVVLKSPPHTARIKTLLEMFPNARFVHIVRNPQVLFPSTLNLWKRLWRDEGLQVPHYQGLEEYVFETFNRMYAAFDRDRELLRPGQFCEVRYEDLVADPIEQMRTVYEQLALDGFDGVRPAFESYFSAKKDYKTNRYQSSPETQAEVKRRWGWYAERYGYAD
jgi:omega-hydroxy-beta-dihydromenaquinone-9 sulfotransferase